MFAFSLFASAYFFMITGRRPVYIAFEYKEEPEELKTFEKGQFKIYMNENENFNEEVRIMTLEETDIADGNAEDPESTGYRVDTQTSESEL